MNERKSWFLPVLVAILWVKQAVLDVKDAITRVGKGCLLVALLASPAWAAPVELVGQRVLGIYGPTNLYSVERVGDRIWIGGGPFGVRPWDEIYRLSQECGPELVLSFANHHLNDPSVVRRATDGKWLMYTTTAPYDAINTISLFESNDGEVFSFVAHLIADGGSPSAVVVGNEIWVYYTPMGWQPQQAHRQRFAADGVTRLGGAQVLTAGGGIWAIGNIDVTPFRSGYVATGNRSLNEVWISFSADGVNYEPAQIIIGSAGLVTAPHVGILNSDYLTISFSYSDVGLGTAYHYSSHDWMFRIAGTSSLVPTWPSTGVCASETAPPPPPPPPPQPIEQPWWCAFWPWHPDCQ